MLPHVCARPCLDVGSSSQPGMIMLGNDNRAVHILKLKQTLFLCRHMFTSGDEYDGEWRGGLMFGQGTFVWSGGERYDGAWKVRL